MAYSDGLRQLAAVVEALEDSGASIVSAYPERGEGAPSGDADAFRVHLRVDLPLDDSLSGVDPIDGTVRGGDRTTDSTGGTDPDEDGMGTAATDGTPTGTTSESGGVDDEVDGRETATGGTTPGGDSSTPGAGVETGADATRGVAVGGATGPEEGVDCRHAECDRVFDSEHGMKIHFTKMHGTDDPDGAGTAPYRDPDRLRAAYGATGSFAAMRDELGVDVSPETVRRYAVRYGIHERGTATAEGSEPAPPAPDATDATDLPPAVRPTSEPEEVAHEDGTGDGDDGETDAGESAADPTPDPSVDVALPGDLTLADLKATVRTSDTLYQASSALDLDRDRTADLLGDLNLLDLVHGRVATKGERDELKADIDARLREGHVGPSLSS